MHEGWCLAQALKCHETWAAYLKIVCEIYVHAPNIDTILKLEGEHLGVEIRSVRQNIGICRSTSVVDFLTQSAQ